MLWVLIIVLLTAFPIGYWLAYLCRDELAAGRKWFFILAVISFISSIVASIFWNKSAVLALDYITIVSVISFWKSHDKKFLGKYSKGNT